MRALSEKLDRSLRWLAVRYCRAGEDFEDLWQEARIAALEAQATFRAGCGSSYETYAVNRARFALASRLRTQRRQRVETRAIGVREEWSVPADAYFRDRRLWLWCERALAGCPPAWAGVLYLRAQGLSDTEIAAETGLPVRYVNWALTAARQRLRPVFAVGMAREGVTVYRKPVGVWRRE